MPVYVYDGSFEGLLTAIYGAYYRRESPERFLPAENLQLSLIDRYVPIDTDREKSDRVYRAVLEKISKGAMEKAYHVFLSNADNKDTLIYHYFRLGWKIGKKVDLHLSDACVLEVHRISRRVLWEVNKFMGFVRFRRMDGDIYYAAIEPDNNIVELLAPHFSMRFADQYWVIHDLKRNLAAIYNRETWVMVRNAPAYSLPPAKDEKGEMEYQRLWKVFFRTIAIESRTNPKLQKRLMPVRYWKHLSEYGLTSE